MTVVAPCPSCGAEVDVLACFDAHACVECGTGIDRLQTLARQPDAGADTTEVPADV